MLPLAIDNLPLQLSLIFSLTSFGFSLLKDQAMEILPRPIPTLVHSPLMPDPQPHSSCSRTIAQATLATFVCDKQIVDTWGTQRVEEKGFCLMNPKPRPGDDPHHIHCSMTGLPYLCEQAKCWCPCSVGRVSPKIVSRGCIERVVALAWVGA